MRSPRRNGIRTVWGDRMQVHGRWRVEGGLMTIHVIVGLCLRELQGAMAPVWTVKLQRTRVLLFFFSLCARC